VLLGLQLHQVIESLHHAVAEHEYLGTGHGLVAIGHRAVLVDILVDGQRIGLAGGQQQCAEEEGTPEHEFADRVVVGIRDWQD
jgi:hypothetical protein